MVVNMIRRNEHPQKQLFGFSRPIKDLLVFSEDKPVHVFCKTLDAMILEANDLQAIYIANSSRNEIIGKNFKDFIPSEIEKSMWLNDNQAIKSNTIKLFIENAIGTPFLSLKTQVRDSNNHIIGIAGLSFNLTQVALPEIINVINQLSLTTALPSFPLMPPSTISFCNLPLSEREKECVQYISKGMSAKEIGRTMNISYRTAEAHIAKIKFKLNCQTRSQIIDKISQPC